MQRLKITAKLKSNLIINDELYLDGIIYSAMRKKQLGADYYNLQRFGEMQGNSIPKIKLPIQRKNKVYLASKACYKLQLEYVNWWRKRWDECSALEWCELKRIYTNQKTTKNYNYPIKVSILKNNEIWWYCIGDKNKIEELLNKCHAIGKEQGQGYGIVDKWSIEESKHKGVRVFPVIYKRNIKKNEIIFKENFNPPYTRQDKKVDCVYRKF